MGEERAEHPGVGLEVQDQAAREDAQHGVSYALAASRDRRIARVARATCGSRAGGDGTSATPAAPAATEPGNCSLASECGAGARAGGAAAARRHGHWLGGPGAPPAACPGPGAAARPAQHLLRCVHRRAGPVGATVAVVHARTVRLVGPLAGAGHRLWLTPGPGDPSGAPEPAHQAAGRVPLLAALPGPGLARAARRAGH